MSLSVPFQKFCAVSLIRALVLGSAFCFSAAPALAGKTPKAVTARAPATIAALPVGEAGASSSPLDVRGQNRAWSRMVRARGEKETVNFVQTRRDYRTEIESSRF